MSLMLDSQIATSNHSPRDLSFITSVMFFHKFLQEAVIKKKYGGLLPKKNPLISKVNYLRFCVLSVILAGFIYVELTLALTLPRIMNVLSLTLLIGHWERYVMKFYSFEFAMSVYPLHLL